MQNDKEYKHPFSQLEIQDLVAFFKLLIEIDKRLQAKEMNDQAAAERES